MDGTDRLPRIPVVAGRHCRSRTHGEADWAWDAVIGGIGLIGLVVALGMLATDRSTGPVAVVFDLLGGLLGGILLVTTNRGPGAHRRYRRWLGAGITSCMLPTLLRWIHQPQLTQVVWLCCIAVGVGMVLYGVAGQVGLAQRSSSLRAALEAAALGMVLSAVAWRLVIHDVVPDSRALNTAYLFPVTGFIIGLAILALAEFKDLGFAVSAAGASCLILANHTNAYLVWTGHLNPPVYAVASTIGWPMIIIGLRHSFVPAAQELTPKDAISEQRSLTMVATFAMAGIALVAWSMRDGAAPDAVTLWYLGGAVLLIWLRELTRATQMSSLLNRLATESSQDPLTGLLNLRQLDRNLQSATERPGPLTALTLDLVRFKQVNDMRGRPTGDRLLCEVSSRLAPIAADAEGTCYRISADEFVLLLPGTVGQALHRVEQARAAVTQAAERVLGPNGFPVHAVCGLADLEVSSSTGMDDLRQLLNQSAVAMREAKLTGLPVVVFQETLATRQHRAWTIEGSLRGTPRSRPIEVAYQPIWSLKRARLTGVEALARMQDPELGEVSPDEFITVAESQGLIREVGRDIFRQALSDAVISGLFGAGRRMSVNVSPLQLREPNFAARLQQTLTEFQVPAESVMIEVTESVLVADHDAAVSALHELHALGVPITLDDFGTGYSSLSYLARLPVAGLKIDRSLTQNLSDPKTIALVTSIASMAETLQLEVIAEGVETLEQEQQIAAVGIDLVQGWRYGRPMDLPALENLLRDLRTIAG